MPRPPALGPVFSAPPGVLSPPGFSPPSFSLATAWASASPRDRSGTSAPPQHVPGWGFVWVVGRFIALLLSRDQVRRRRPGRGVPPGTPRLHMACRRGTEGPRLTAAPTPLWHGLSSAPHRAGAGPA